MWTSETVLKPPRTHSSTAMHLQRVAKKNTWTLATGIGILGVLQQRHLQEKKCLATEEVCTTHVSSRIDLKHGPSLCQSQAKKYISSAQSVIWPILARLEHRLLKLTCRCNWIIKERWGLWSLDCSTVHWQKSPTSAGCCPSIVSEFQSIWTIPQCLRLSVSLHLS